MTVCKAEMEALLISMEASRDVDLGFANQGDVREKCVATVFGDILHHLRLGGS